MRTAFTLVELLVIIAIIGILAALLLPALSRTKAQGNSAVCKNHLRQIAAGLEMYVHDHEVTRHGKNYNQSFCDGHVSAMSPSVLFNPTNSSPMWNSDHQPHPELWFPDKF